MKGLFVVAGMVACQPILTNTPKPEFWPDAPRPRAPAQLHQLAYQPDHVVGLFVRDETRMRGAAGETATTSTTKTRFVAGANSHSRDQFLDEMHVGRRGGNWLATFSVTHDALTTDDGHGHVKSVVRGDADFATVAEQVDRPVLTVTFETNKPRAVDWNPKLGPAPVRGAILPFIELPTEALAVGQTWTSISVQTLPNQLGQIAMTLELRYLGDSNCPTAPTRTCALIELTGRSEETPITVAGKPATITAGYEGKLFFDIDAGVPDEVRLHEVMDVDLKVAAIDFDSVLTITPSAR